MIYEHQARIWSLEADVKRLQAEVARQTGRLRNLRYRIVLLKFILSGKSRSRSCADMIARISLILDRAIAWIDETG